MTQPESNNPGSILRTTREKLGLSLNDVTLATKISPRIIRALEDGNKNGLPAASFSRGFIRSYAAYLKIDARPILEGFNLSDVTKTTALPTENANENNIEASTVEVNSKPSVEQKTSLKIPTEPGVKSKIYVAVGLVLFVLVFFGIKQVFDKYSNERFIESLPAIPSNNLEPVTDAAPNKIDTQTNPTSNDESIAQNEGDIKNDQTKPSEPVAANPAITATPTVAVTKAAEVKSPTVTTSIETKTPTATPTATPPTKVENESSANLNTPRKTNEPLDKNKTPQAPTKESPVNNTAAAVIAAPEKPATPQELLVEALDQVQITVTIDDGTTKKINLTPGSIHRINAKKSLRLEAQDGGMINLIHNGRDKGVPGDLGKPIQLKYP